VKKTIFFAVLGVVMMTASAFAANSEGVNLKPQTAEEWQKYLNFRREEALEDLYALKPEAKAVIEKAQGYAVFSSFGMKILIVGSGNGRGILHDNKTGKDTYMRMLQAGVGFGFGAKDFRSIFVFANRDVMDQFLTSGWTVGGEASASAKAEEQGASSTGAITVAPGVSVYQLTENGLMVDAMVNGTKYWVDEDMNK
jgi:lipid-binding SYLF domain-containing protein